MTKADLNDRWLILGLRAVWYAALGLSFFFAIPAVPSVEAMA